MFTFKQPWASYLAFLGLEALSIKGDCGHVKMMYLKHVAQRLTCSKN